jgi:hypothetical protein
MPAKILFLLKRREDFDAKQHNHKGLSTGLYNSAKFMDDMLNESGIESHLEVVVDNNCIDREVTKYRPTHCIIEALWVVPEKFKILSKLHPTVTWILRLHSDIPFMSAEGMAMEWVGDYAAFDNLIIAPNDPRMVQQMRLMLKLRYQWSDEEIERRVVYLPNYYTRDRRDRFFHITKDTVNISCFGAMRPLKNHLNQAFAAIKFADKIGKRLKFHINSTRIEGRAEPVLRNLKDLFVNVHDSGHQLVGHAWHPREEFLKICDQIDIGLQVSFNETFNIVAADLISRGVPVVGSREIPWLDPIDQADPTDVDDIVRHLQQVYDDPGLNIFRNRVGLLHYTEKTQSIWSNYFKGF